MSTTRTWTDEELLALPDDGLKRELVDGEIVVMNAAGGPHGRVIMELAFRIESHVRPKRLGWLFDGQTGCRLPSGNMCIPDISFIARERMPRGVAPGLLHVVPDLAVEVLSPDDRPRQVLDKVGEYLVSGVRLVWVIDPVLVAAACYRSLTDVTRVDRDGELEGGDVLPGFRCALADLVRDLDVAD